MRFLLQELDTLTKNKLIEYCAGALNYQRHGSRTPYYLWAASNRREVEVVLTAAEDFFGQKVDK